jgi:hypothetical protein
MMQRSIRDRLRGPRRTTRILASQLLYAQSPLSPDESVRSSPCDSVAAAKDVRPALETEPDAKGRGPWDRTMLAPARMMRS